MDTVVSLERWISATGPTSQEGVILFISRPSILNDTLLIICFYDMRSFESWYRLIVVHPYM